MLAYRSIQGFIILAIGTFLAIWLGLSIVTDQVETILQVLLALVLITCFALGRRIWLLIPFMAHLDVTLRLPGHPDSLLLGQVLTLMFCGMLFLMRKLPYRLAWTELEFWVLILTLLIAQVYMRNPTGVSLFGGEIVGGRSYALYVIAFASTVLLSGLRVPISHLKLLLPLSIIGGFLNFTTSLLGIFVPSIGYLTGADFVQSDETNYEDINTAVDSGAATRVGFLTIFGENLSLWISSYISPLRALLRPLWAILVFIALVAAMMGGFRIGVMVATLTFFVGIVYRSGLGGLAFSTLGVIGAIAFLAVVNLILPLPPNMQRSLTFLPGTWEERYREDAKGSSEWRFEVWREALTSERWIHNKWLGDGLGFTAAELAAQQNVRQGARVGISGFEAQRESVLVNGDYHSGPVSTVRVIGYIGLFLFLVASFRLAVHAHRQIIRCRGTEWYSLALFTGIPIILAPLTFIFLFGDFKKAAYVFLLSCGMIRLLQNNIPLPAYAKKAREAYSLAKAGKPKPPEAVLSNSR